jgi:hypothetical protein
LILISYGIKILATGQWPEGQLVYMVTGYVWFWLLTWFAVLPLEQKNTRLSKAYRVLFASFFVTSWLMIGALLIRVHQYGWTIDRGLVVALIVWIIVMSGWSFLWTSRRWMIGLGWFVLISLVSIWTIPSLIKSHHLAQTKTLMTIAQNTTGDATKLYSSLAYLVNDYGTWWTDEVFTQEQLIGLSWTNTRDFATQAMWVLGITNYEVNDWRWTLADSWSFYSEAKEDVVIAWWSRLRPFQSWRDDQTHDTVQWTPNSNSIGFTGTDIVLDLTPHIAERKKQSTNWTAQQAYLITGATYQLIITQANSRFDDSNLVDSLGGYLLVK